MLNLKVRLAKALVLIALERFKQLIELRGVNRVNKIAERAKRFFFALLSKKLLFLLVDFSKLLI